MSTTYLLDDAIAYIEANSSYVLGTNLFASMLPDTPDAAVVVLEYSGGEPIYVMGPNPLPAIAQPHLQLVVRDPDYMTARAGAEALTRLLESIVNQTVNTTYYLRVARLQDPFFLRRDAVKNRIYFCCNFEVMRTPS